MCKGKYSNFCIRFGAFIVHHTLDVNQASCTSVSFYGNIRDGANVMRSKYSVNKKKSVTRASSSGA